MTDSGEVDGQHVREPGTMTDSGQADEQDAHQPATPDGPTRRHAPTRRTVRTPPRAHRDRRVTSASTVNHGTPARGHAESCPSSAGPCKIHPRTGAGDPRFPVPPLSLYRSTPTGTWR